MEKEGGLIYPKQSYIINGLLFSVHNEIGRYAKEKQYADRFEILCIEKNVPCLREVSIGGSGNRIDFIVFGCILLEFKAKRIVTKEDYQQTQRYLQETQMKLGLLVNFRDLYIKPKRVVRIDTPHGEKFVRREH